MLRYVSSQHIGAEPSVFVRTSEISRETIEIISPPGSDQGVLDGPGSCLVLRAMRSGTIDVLVRARSEGKDDAELRLEALSRPAAVAANSELAGGAAVEVTGHVSRRGDVVAPAGDWIAGPQAPARIEGIALRLVNGDGGIEYQVLSSPGGPWSAWSSDGTYAGSRGQHRPLLGVRARLTGVSSGDWRLRAEGLFLGAPVKVSAGASIDLTSDSGLDPMVGLKIALVASQETTDRLQDLPPASQGSGRASGVGRVRVFRASGQR